MLISVPSTDGVTVPPCLRRPGWASAEQAPNARRAGVMPSATLLVIPRFAPRDDIQSLLRHVRIFVIRRWGEGLLDRARAHPAHQVQLRARLVVRSRTARAAERLLSDHGAGWLVVDVEIPRGVPQSHHRFANRPALRREHSARERVWRRGVDDLERLLPPRVVVYVRRDDRAEDLLAQQAISWV